jgi:hypothetical protein
VVWVAATPSQSAGQDEPLAIDVIQDISAPHRRGGENDMSIDGSPSPKKKRTRSKASAAKRLAPRGTLKK